MSNENILYVKGMHNLESEDDEENDEDIWDDSKLNDAYDKALKIANAEVAKRVAMSTNSQPKIKTENSQKKKDKPATKPNSSKNNNKPTKSQWKAGMPCRAIYEDDGLEYEAFILTILSNRECVVRFLGYENSEIVAINSLKPTFGKEARTRQIEEALHDKSDGAYMSQSPNPDSIDDGSNRDEKVASPGSTAERLFSRKQKSPKKKKKNQKSIVNGLNLQDMPMPNLGMFLNMGSNDMPLPPPPPMAFPSSNHSDSEEQAISSMLLSWYMSGYYTGLYQGLKRGRENRRNQ